jgi:hypothetical protein
MKKIVLILLFCSVSLFSFSWGAKGHKIVAEIAYRALDKSIIDSVQYFLGNMTFQEAAVWMDEVRSNSAYDYLKPKHYVNAEKDVTYVKTKGDDVVNELDAVLAILAAKGPRDKDKIAMALRELFHLVGDIHQPLHCGYGEDKGGNAVPVTYGDSQNLHSMWDTGLIREENIGLNDCLTLINSIPLTEQKAIQKIDVISWVKESRSYLPFIYNYGTGKITREYADEAKPIIEKQLSRAGIRLASILYTTFKK